MDIEPLIELELSVKRVEGSWAGPTYKSKVRILYDELDRTDFEPPTMCIRVTDEDNDTAWMIVDKDSLQELISALQVAHGVLKTKV